MHVERQCRELEKIEETRVYINGNNVTKQIKKNLKYKTPKLELDQKNVPANFEHAIAYPKKWEEK